MDEDINLHLHGDWQHLPEQVLRVAQSWQKFWTDAFELYDTGYMLDMEDGSDSNVIIIRHLFWLIPLAEVLQQHTKLHGFIPLVHHSVIELRFEPSAPGKCIVLYALVEGVFQATLVMDVPSISSSHVKLGEGDAQTIVHLLETFAEKL